MCVFISMIKRQYADFQNIKVHTTSLEHRSGNEDCVTRRVRYSCTVIGR